MQYFGRFLEHSQHWLLRAFHCIHSSGEEGEFSGENDPRSKGVRVKWIIEDEWCSSNEDRLRSSSLWRQGFKRDSSID